MKDALRVRRRQLDSLAARVRDISLPPVPARGWIDAIRSALGMTNQDLARRLKVTAPAAHYLQRAEASGGITLKRLRQAAEALDCELVYALVPRTSLEEMVRQRAHEIATARVRSVGHTMALESQDVGSQFAQQEIDDLAAELIRSGKVWKIDQ